MIRTFESIEGPVTLRQLLSHTSGINRRDSMLFFEENSTPTLLDVLNGELPSINDAVTVESVPGEWHRYSNLAYNVIQLLIEEATGKAFTSVMQEVLAGLADQYGWPTVDFEDE